MPEKLNDMYKMCWTRTTVFVYGNECTQIRKLNSGQKQEKKLNKFSIHDDCIQRNQPTNKKKTQLTKRLKRRNNGNNVQNIYVCYHDTKTRPTANILTHFRIISILMHCSVQTKKLGKAVRKIRENDGNGKITLLE